VRWVFIDAGIAILAENTIAAIFILRVAIFVEVSHQRLCYSLAVLADLTLTIRLKIAAYAVEFFLLQLFRRLALMRAVDTKAVLVVVMRYTLDNPKVELGLLSSIEKVHPHPRQKAVARVDVTTVALCPLAEHNKDHQSAIAAAFPQQSNSLVLHLRCIKQFLITQNRPQPVAS
jgi:hypothetical protein